MPLTRAESGEESGSNFSVGQILPHFANNKEEDIEFFLSQFEDLANLEGWTEVYKNVILKSRIRGKALERLNLTTAFRKSTDLAETIKILTHNFKKTKSNDEVQAEFNNLTHSPTTSIKELALDIDAKAANYMAEDAQTAATKKLVDKIKLNKFLDIVRPDIKFEIKKVHPQPQTFNDAISLAKTIENALREKPLELNNFNASQSKMPSTASYNLEAIEARQTAQEYQLNEILSQLKTLTINNVQNQAASANFLTQRPQYRQTPAQHQQTQTQQQVRQTQRPLCACCGKAGHLMAYCFYNPNAARQQPVYPPQAQQTYSPQMQQPFYTPTTNFTPPIYNGNRFPPPINNAPRFSTYGPNFRQPFRHNGPCHLN